MSLKFDNTFRDQSMRSARTLSVSVGEKNLLLYFRFQIEFLRIKKIERIEMELREMVS